MIKMTSKERFYAAVRFQEVDRVPTDLHNFALCARASGKSFDRFVLDPEAMAEAQIALHKEFGHDVLLVENGTASLAQAMGCEISLREDDPPVADRAVLRGLEEMDKLVVSGKILEAPLLKANLQAVRLLRKKLGDSVVIMGRGDQGPFSLASQILGMNELLTVLGEGEMDAEIAALLELCARAGIICCTAMLEAGAHCTSIGDSTAGPDVISPAMYERFARPYEKKLIDAVHGAGGMIALHICGNAGAIIEGMVDTGADILELDQKTDLGRAWPVCRGRAAVLGQISPVTLMNGTPGDVALETGEMLEKVGGRKASGVILGPGCALGGLTPYENIHAMLRQARQEEKDGSYSGII